VCHNKQEPPDDLSSELEVVCRMFRLWLKRKNLLPWSHNYSGLLSYCIKLVIEKTSPLINIYTATISIHLVLILALLHKRSGLSSFN